MNGYPYTPGWKAAQRRYVGGPTFNETADEAIIRRTLAAVEMYAIETGSTLPRLVAQYAGADVAKVSDVADVEGEAA